jgi:putative ABC transport system substrate-binding protein
LLYNDKFSSEYVALIKKDARSLGLEVIAKEIKSEQEIGSSLNELLPKIDIFWVISDPMVLANDESIHQIFQTAKKLNKPIYAYSDVFIKQGAVLTISPDIATIGRQSASLVLQIDENRIPKGTVQIPAGSDITLNKCAIDSLHINFNQEALDSVNNIVSCD